MIGILLGMWLAGGVIVVILMNAAKILVRRKYEQEQLRIASQK